MLILIVTFLICSSVSLNANEVFPFPDGNGLWGLIEIAGNGKEKVIISGKYHNLNMCGEKGLFPAKIDDKWGFINKKGKVIINFQYEEVNIFVKGLAAIKLNDKWGFINEKGKVIIDFQYEEVWDFDYRGITIVIKDGREFCINKKGKEVVPCP